METYTILKGVDNMIDGFYPEVIRLASELFSEEIKAKKRFEELSKFVDKFIEDLHYLGLNLKTERAIIRYIYRNPVEFNEWCIDCLHDPAKLLDVRNIGPKSAKEILRKLQYRQDQLRYF